MHSRFFVALFAAGALCSGAAIAAPPLGVPPVGVPRVGAPPVGVPPVGVPPVHVPPAHVPPANANVNGQTHAQAQSSVSADVLHGSVAAVNGTTVTMNLSNGTTATYAISAQTASRLQSQLNKTIAYRVQNGTLALVGSGSPPLQGTLEALSGTTAQIKLPKRTVLHTVTNQQAAWLKLHTGKQITFWTNANGSIELNQRSHAAKASQRAKHKSQ